MMGVASKLLLVIPLLIATAVAASEPRPVPDAMAQRVLACTVCHGKEGRATAEGYLPRIAGKPAGYLFNQLINFRDGRRNFPIMVYLVEHLTDSYLREIAEHFAALDLPYSEPQRAGVSADVMARGEALVRYGNPATKVPACAECHGDKLLGVNPNVPGLLGLSRYYLYAQIGFWKNGERRAHAPDCMAAIASRLTPAEVEAVSSWLAAQRVPPGGRPAAGFRGEPPMACGSVLQ